MLHQIHVVKFSSLFCTTMSEPKRLISSADSPESTVRGSNRRREASRRCLAGIVLAGLAVVALALGLGLGLGLRHRHSDLSSATTSGANNGSTPTSTNSSLQHVQLQDASAFFLKGSAILNDPPQTRTFNFVLEERLGAPDGFEKTMLVVNGELSFMTFGSFIMTDVLSRTGIYPGPTIEVNEGDRIIVNVTNRLPNAT